MTSTENLTAIYWTKNPNFENSGTLRDCVISTVMNPWLCTFFIIQTVMHIGIDYKLSTQTTATCTISKVALHKSVLLDLLVLVSSGGGVTSL